MVKASFMVRTINARVVVKSERNPARQMRCLAPRSTLRQAPRKACEPPRCGQPAQGLCSEAQQDHPFSCLRFPGNQGGQRLEPAMDVYFYTRLRQPAPLCRCGSAQSVELHSLNGTLA